MALIKAVVFDFIGTLTSVRGYSLEASKMKLYNAIVSMGFKVDVDSFMQAYSHAHEKHRLIRYEQLVEVTNAVWTAEALQTLGFNVQQDDGRVKAAVNVFFEDYVRSLELNAGTQQLLKELSGRYKLGLISNFTYAPVIYAGLRKLGISCFFNAVSVSQAVGWRKPSERIFTHTLRCLGVSAEEAIYVGDSPFEDVEGAAAVGMKTVFIPSQFCSMRDLQESGRKPDFVVSCVRELHDRFPSIVKSLGCQRQR